MEMKSKYGVQPCVSWGGALQLYEVQVCLGNVPTTPNPLFSILPLPLLPGLYDTFQLLLQLGPEPLCVMSLVT